MSADTPSIGSAIARIAAPKIGRRNAAPSRLPNAHPAIARPPQNCSQNPLAPLPSGNSLAIQHENQSQEHLRAATPTEAWAVAMTNARMVNCGWGIGKWKQHVYTERIPSPTAAAKTAPATPNRTLNSARLGNESLTRCRLLATTLALLARCVHLYRTLPSAAGFFRPREQANPVAVGVTHGQRREALRMQPPRPHLRPRPF